MGIGLAIGSFIGGQLTYAQAAGLASAVNARPAVIVIVGLPVLQRHPSSSSAKGGSAASSGPQRGRSRSPSPGGRATVKGAAKAAALPLCALAVMVTMRLLFSSCATAQRETFALAVKSRMNMSEGWIGAFLSYKGVVAMLANSAGLVPLLASGRWPSHVVLLAACSGLATSYTLSALALHTSSSALLAFTQLPLTVTTNVCRTLLQARTPQRLLYRRTATTSNHLTVVCVRICTGGAAGSRRSGSAWRDARLVWCG